MSFFDNEITSGPTDLASRIGDWIGIVLVILTYALIIYPVVYSFIR